jgi:exonuclease VII small subunit
MEKDVKEFAAMEVPATELVTVLRSVALALEESTRMLVRITELHDEAAGVQGQLAEALADLEQILAHLEDNPVTLRDGRA